MFSRRNCHISPLPSFLSTQLLANNLPQPPFKVSWAPPPFHPLHRSTPVLFPPPHGTPPPPNTPGIRPSNLPSHASLLPGPLQEFTASFPKTTACDHDHFSATFNGQISAVFFFFLFLQGDFFIFLIMYDVQHCFICRPWDPTATVLEDAGIEPRTVATTALTVRLSNHSATSHLSLLSSVTGTKYLYI